VPAARGESPQAGVLGLVAPVDRADTANPGAPLPRDDERVGSVIALAIELPCVCAIIQAIFASNERIKDVYRQIIESSLLNLVK
jgi:hypothetical protein